MAALRQIRLTFAPGFTSLSRRSPTMPLQHCKFVSGTTETTPTKSVNVKVERTELAKEPDNVKLSICGDDQVDGEEEMEEMLVDGPKGKEWGGPTRGGRLSEPTRFGDWERKGRCSDF
ncbi:unnamed protein product [Discosporangium mesarthrocarpum]